MKPRSTNRLPPPYETFGSFRFGMPPDADLLGLDENGRLVLAELKRDGAPSTVEMQAVKYAAYASRFSPETLAACHGHYLRATVDEAITDEDALAQEQDFTREDSLDAPVFLVEDGLARLARWNNEVGELEDLPILEDEPDD